MSRNAYLCRQKSNSLKYTGYEEDINAPFCGSSIVSALAGSGEVRSERWIEPDELIAGRVNR